MTISNPNGRRSFPLENLENHHYYIYSFENVVDRYAVHTQVMELLIRRSMQNNKLVARNLDKHDTM